MSGAGTAPCSMHGARGRTRRSDKNNRARSARHYLAPGIGRRNSDASHRPRAEAGGAAPSIAPSCCAPRATTHAVDAARAAEPSATTARGDNFRPPRGAPALGAKISSEFGGAWPCEINARAPTTLPRFTSRARRRDCGFLGLLTAATTAAWSAGRGPDPRVARIEDTRPRHQACSWRVSSPSGRELRVCEVA
jgi:hypothetical protein